MPFEEFLYWQAFAVIEQSGGVDNADVDTKARAVFAQLTTLGG